MSHTPPPGIPVHDEDATTEHVPVDPPKPWFSLTDREREVADMLCRGWKNAEIADAMGISVKTVDTHRGHVLAKLKLRNNVALLRYGLARGWVTVERGEDQEVS